MSPLPRAARLLPLNPTNLLLRKPQTRLLLQSRLYSTPKLAKPARFVPPSHSSSKPLARDPINYPGPPTSSNPQKRYPNSFPPKGTWAYFFLTSRKFHFFFTLWTLIFLALITGINRWFKTDPHCEQIYWKPWTEPINTFKSVWDVFVVSTHHETVRTQGIIDAEIREIEYRDRYRQAHDKFDGPFQGINDEWRLKRPEEDGQLQAKLKFEMEKEQAVQEAMAQLKEAEEERKKRVEEKKRKQREEQGIVEEVKVEEPVKAEEKAEKKKSWYKFW